MRGIAELSCAASSEIASLTTQRRNAVVFADRGRFTFEAKRPALVLKIPFPWFYTYHRMAESELFSLQLRRPATISFDQLQFIELEMIYPYMLTSQTFARCSFFFFVLGHCTIDVSRGEESADSKSFGVRQIEQMLEDRPEMKNVVSATHPIFAFLEDSFNGKFVGRRIYWSDEFPLKGLVSYAVPARERLNLPYVTVTNDLTLCTPLDKWIAVVFELNNLLNYQDFNNLSEKRKDLTEDEFIFQFRKIEYNAYLKTHSWLVANPFSEDVDEKSLLVRYILDKVSLEDFAALDGGKKFLSKVYKGLPDLR